MHPHLATPFEIRSDCCNLNSIHTDSDINPLNTLAQKFGFFPIEFRKGLTISMRSERSSMTGVSQTKPPKFENTRF